MTEVNLETSKKISTKKLKNKLKHFEKIMIHYESSPGKISLYFTK